MHTAFAKYEGAGNDFILIDNRDGHFTPDACTIARMCDRHFGIGADGMMTLQGHGTSYTMRYYNADGSEGEMCGNGARCFALFAEHLSIGGAEKHFEARDGLHTARIIRRDGAAGEIELGMCAVGTIRRDGAGWALDTGVPHYVEFTDDLAAVDVVARGRAIRRDTSRFPRGTNVNFVEAEGPGMLRIRTYERGVEEETLACGTGCTAAALVADLVFGPDTDRYRIAARGGELGVTFRRTGTGYTDIRLTGPARRVFEGVFDPQHI